MGRNNTHQEKVDSGIPKYIIGYSSTISCEGVPIPETPKFFPTLWWGRGNVSQETLWPSASRDAEFLFNIHWTTDRTFWPHQGPKNIEE